MTNEPRSGSEKTSGENREPSEERSSSEKSNGESRETREGGGDDIPLNIAGHGEREKPRSESAESLFADDSASEANDGAGASEPATAESEPEDEDDEVEPVELLVQLAKEGEIEPWDIDIVEVTDKFLDALDEADLRTSGRALFYASVLLRMKSDVMWDDGEDEEEELEEELPPWEAPPGEEGEYQGPDPIAALEDEMERRLDRKSARGKPETLDELVRELREAERGSWWKESREYDTVDSPQGFRRGVQTLDYHTGDDMRMDDEPTAEDVTGTAHEEDIETTIEDVEARLDEQYGAGREEVLYEEVADAGGTRVETFLALLFLAHRGAVTLSQDELFGDLWVRDGSAPERTEEPVAADGGSE